VKGTFLRLYCIRESPFTIDHYLRDLSPGVSRGLV
jgi:hypothetical protein